MSGPMFSRMALAAALLEYDNDTVDPQKIVDHKKSAMFRQFEAHNAPYIPPLGIDSEDTGDIGDPRSSAGQRRDYDPEFESRLSADATMRDPRHRARTRSVAFSTTTGPRSINLESVEDEDYYDGKYENRDGRYHRPSIDSRQSRGSYDHAERALSEAQRVRDMLEGRRSVSAIGALEVRNDMGEPVMVPLPESPPKMAFPHMPGSRPGSGIALESPLSPTFDRPQSRSQSAMSAYSNPPLNQDEHDQEVLRNPFELPAPPPEFGSRFDPKTIEAQRRSIDLPGSRPLSTVSSMGPRASSSMPGDMAFGDFATPRLERRASLVYSDDGEGAPSFMAGAPSENLTMDDLRRESRVWNEIPSAAEYGRPLRAPKYTDRVLHVKRRELLRPKTLVMPSILEGTEKQKHSVHVPEGFTLGEKPLPEDARASVLNLGHGVPLSMAQKTFRSSLMVGGHREDAEYFAGTAAEGEIIAGYEGEDDEEEEDMHMRRKPGKLYGTSLIDQLELRKEQMHSKQRQFWGDNRPSMMARQSTLIDPNALQAPPQAPVQNDADLLSPHPRSVPGSLNKRPNTMHDVPTLNVPDGDGGDSADQRMGKSRSVFGVDTLWEREMVKLKGIQEAQSKADAEAAEKEAAKERKKAERAEKRKSRWGRKSKMLDASDAPQFDEHGRPMSMMPGSSGMGSLNSMNSMGSDPRMSRLSMMDPRMGSDDVEELDGRYDQYDGQYDGSNASTAERIPARPPTLSFEPENPAIGSIEPEQPAPPPERRPGSRLGVDDWFQSSDEEDGGNARSRNRPVSAQPPQLAAPVSDGESSDEELPLSRLRRVQVDDDDSSSDEDVPLSRIKAQVVDSDEEVPLSQLKKGALPPLALDTGAGSGSLGLLPSQPSPRSPAGEALEEASGAAGEVKAAPIVVPAISTPANDDDDDDEPLLIRQARRSRMVMSPAGESAASGSNAGASQTVEEIEDDLPLAWKHAGAAQRQHEARKGASPQPGPGMQPGMQHMPSFYGSPYGMPGMAMSAYGMPQMGQMGMMQQPMMGMPMQQPMMPHMMGGMPGMPGMGMGMPGMGGMGGMGMQAFEDPGSNIDHWRKQVELAPMPTGSGQSVSTRGP